METVEKKKWRPFRRGRNNGRKADQPDEDEKRKGGGLFGRKGRKSKNGGAKTKTATNKPPSKRLSGVPVIIPSHSFEKDENVKFKMAEELKAVEVKKDDWSQSTGTHKDSVSSAQEDSVTGDFIDPAATTVANEANESKEVQIGHLESFEEQAHDEFTRDIVHEFEQISLEEYSPEISSEVVSQPQTANQPTSAGSPGGRKCYVQKMEAEDEEEEDAFSVSESPTMPDEVVLGKITMCSTNEELTVFSESSDDRALGISTPPALKRNRSKNTNDSQSEPLDSGMIEKTESFGARSVEMVRAGKKQADAEKKTRRQELDTIKEQLEEERQRIKQQLAEEDARMADLAARDSERIHHGEEQNGENRPTTMLEAKTDNAFANKVTAPAEGAATSTREVESSGLAGEAKNATTKRPHCLQSNTWAAESSLEAALPMKERSMSSRATSPMDERSGLPLVYGGGPAPSRVEMDTPITDTSSQHQHVQYEAQKGLIENGMEEGHETPLLKRTTSEGSKGLEKTSKRSGQRGRSSSGDSHVAEEAQYDALHDYSRQHMQSTVMSGGAEGTEVKIPHEQKKKRRKMRRKYRRKGGVSSQGTEKRGEKQKTREKEHKVRVVEDDLASSKCGVEIEHLPNEESDEFDNQSQGSVGSKSWASRSSWLRSRLSGKSDSDDESRYDSDPDPFSGIEERKLASLDIALQNARQAVAKAGETGALVNDSGLSKRPSRVRFQGKAFFKRLKQVREKLDPPGKYKTSGNKVTRRGKMAPQDKGGRPGAASYNNVKKGGTRTPSLSTSAPPPPPKPTMTDPKPTLDEKVFTGVLSERSVAEISRSDSVTNTVLHSNSNARNISTQKAAEDSDSEMDANEGVANDIAANVSLVGKEGLPLQVVSDEEDESEEGNESECSSSDEDASYGEVSLYSEDDESLVASFVHEYPALMTFARTLSRTMTWGGGFSNSTSSSSSRHRQNRTSEHSGSSLVDREEGLANRSFSFSRHGPLEDDSASSDDNDTLLSDDVLMMQGKFACM